MKKKSFLIIVSIIVLICLGAVVVGMGRAAKMQIVSDAGMSLIADSSNISDLDAKLYEIAYSSPVAPEKIGLWLEALLAKKFETFSTDGNPLTSEIAGKLKGWPLKKTIEIDLSSSGTSDDVIANLGSLPSLEWLDLSGTKVTTETVAMIAGNAPNLRKLQLNDTQLTWNKEAVDQLLNHPALKEVELPQGALSTADREKLEAALKNR